MNYLNFLSIALMGIAGYNCKKYPFFGVTMAYIAGILIGLQF